MSAIIITFAVISTVFTASAVIITMLLSYMISSLESNPNETISSAINFPNIQYYYRSSSPPGLVLAKLKLIIEVISNIKTLY